MFVQNHVVFNPTRTSARVWGPVIYYGQLVKQFVGDLSPAAGIQKAPKRSSEPSDYSNRKRGVSNRSRQKSVASRQFSRPVHAPIRSIRISILHHAARPSDGPEHTRV
jgi:hypothetical protein